MPTNETIDVAEEEMPLSHKTPEVEVRGDESRHPGEDAGGHRGAQSKASEDHVGLNTTTEFDGK